MIGAAPEATETNTYPSWMAEFNLANANLIRTGGGSWEEDWREGGGREGGMGITDSGETI